MSRSDARARCCSVPARAWCRRASCARWRADAQPSRSGDDGAARRHPRAARAGVSRRRGSFAFAVSGTGTSGMETAVANLVRPGTRAIVVVSRLLRRSARADVRALRRDGDAAQRGVGTGLRSGRARGGARAAAPTSSTMVHARDVHRRAEPGRASCAAIARAHGALTIVDAVTSLGAHPVDVGELGHRRRLQLHAEVPRRAVRAGAGQFSAGRARCAQRGDVIAGRSISTSRCSRTTGSTASITTRCRRRWSTRCTKRSAIVEEEGLEARWARHEREPPRVRRRPAATSGCRCCRRRASGCGR